MISTNPEVHIEADRLIKYIKDELVWEVREQSVRLEAIRANLSLRNVWAAAKLSESYMEGVCNILRHSSELDYFIRTMLVTERKLNLSLLADYNNPKETT